MQRIEHYIVTSHCLGSGSFATVHLAMDSTAFKQVACKSIRRKINDKIDKVRKEVDILLNLSHVSRATEFRPLVASLSVIQPNINTVHAAIHDDDFL